MKFLLVHPKTLRPNIAPNETQKSESLAPAEHLTVRRVLQRWKESRKFNIYKNCHPLCALSLTEEPTRRRWCPLPESCLWKSLLSFTQGFFVPGPVTRSSAIAWCSVLYTPITRCTLGSKLERFYYINCFTGKESGKILRWRVEEKNKRITPISTPNGGGWDLQG